MTIKFLPPSKSSPGFMRRMKKAVMFGNALSSGNATPDLIDDLVKFLSDYVIEPAGKEAAIEALWDATEEQFIALIEVVKGGSNDPIPPASAAL